MGLRLYNSLTRKVDPFEPLEPPRVTLYACGPTVWNYAHIGNFRTFLFVDLLRRYLRHSGYEVFHVMNLTDVDDRTIAAAGQAGVTVAAHTIPFIEAFFADRDYLRIEPADAYPRATEYIAPMIELVSTLLERGLAYRGEDGSVYYAVGEFPRYGRLAQVEKEALKAGSRVASDEYSKDDVRDFALWKRASPEDEAAGAAWEAPFGRGRPGWHLECSTMALSEIRARFGIETLDIHAGGVDLLFPHHENEIAQSEGATGRPFARCWMHGEFLTVSGTKMSKRFGNVLTARDLRDEGIDAGAVRMLLFSTHYRQQLNFTDAGLEAAAEGVRRLGEFRDRLSEQAAGQGETAMVPVGPAATLEMEFRAALDEDLNGPRAIAAVFSFLRAVNRELDRGQWGGGEARSALEVFERVMRVLDLLPTEVPVGEELRAWAEQRVAAREAARAVRDFATADAIREELNGRGIELEDTPAGPRWKVRGA